MWTEITSCVQRGKIKIMRLSESPRIRSNDNDDGEVVVAVADAVGKTEKHV